jgi:hypothetical protein
MVAVLRHAAFLLPQRDTPAGVVYNLDMADSFGELEAASLFCPRCKRANPVRKTLLLVLPTATKYDYTCSVCGAQVGAKTDSDSSEFHRIASASRKAVLPSGPVRRPSRSALTKRAP